MKFNNQIMLITYADSMGKNIKELGSVLNKYFEGAVGGVHILPFFPSSADRGFAPMDYENVDAQFGNWKDIDELGDRYYLMFDFMINHISSQSVYFCDFVEKKDQSPYCDMFIRYKDFWPGGEPTEEDINGIYKRRPRAPYIDVLFKDGSTEKVWCTFSDEQIDINVNSETSKMFIRNTMADFSRHNAAIVRLDAFAFAVKKIGTSCFFVEPEVWGLLNDVQGMLDADSQLILPEIHEHYSIQLKLAEKGFWVYDFALPMLVLNAIYLHNSRPLKHWLEICPRKQFTTLDTHDGIGVVDVKDLLSDEEIEETKENLFAKGANVKKIYNTVAYNNLDIYQINCTYYSALGNDDNAYLMARAIQFFAPGVPQVYYVGLLAGENDIDLMEKTKQGREINRHAYSVEEIESNMERPVVRKLRNLMKFRNNYPAFSGACVVVDTSDDRLEVHRISHSSVAILRVNFRCMSFEITYGQAGDTVRKLDLEDDS